MKILPLIPYKIAPCIIFHDALDFLTEVLVKKSAHNTHSGYGEVNKSLHLLHNSRGRIGYQYVRRSMCRSFKESRLPAASIFLLLLFLFRQRLRLSSLLCRRFHVFVRLIHLSSPILSLFSWHSLYKFIKQVVLI